MRCTRRCSRIAPTFPHCLSSSPRALRAVTAVFPAYELLGWYAVTAAAAPAAHHADLHAQFSQFNETPVFLHMHTGAVDPNSSDLPVRAYLAQYAASGNSWMACPFRVDTTHTETSALHHTLTEAQSGVGSSDDPRMTQLRATASALAMLDERLSGLVSFVSDVQSGAVPPTTAARACLRDISALLARIPIVSPSPPAHAGDGHALPHAGGAAAASSPAATFAGARATDRADTAVLSLLASVTHSASLLQTVTDKLSAVHADAARAAWEAGDRLSGVWSGDGEGGGRERLGGLGGGALGWRGGRGDRMDPMWREGPGGRERYMGAMGPMGHMGDMGGMLASLTGAGGGGMGMGGGRYDERERDRERSAGSRRKRDVGKS